MCCDTAVFDHTLVNHATFMESVQPFLGGTDILWQPEDLSMFGVWDKTQILLIAMHKAGTVHQPCRTGDAIVCCCNLRADLSDLP